MTLCSYSSEMQSNWKRSLLEVKGLIKFPPMHYSSSLFVLTHQAIKSQTVKCMEFAKSSFFQLLMCSKCTILSVPPALSKGHQYCHFALIGPFWAFLAFCILVERGNTGKCWKATHLLSVAELMDGERGGVIENGRVVGWQQFAGLA